MQRQRNAFKQSLNSKLPKGKMLNLNAPRPHVYFQLFCVCPGILHESAGMAHSVLELAQRLQKMSHNRWACSTKQFEGLVLQLWSYHFSPPPGPVKLIFFPPSFSNLFRLFESPFSLSICLFLWASFFLLRGEIEIKVRSSRFLWSRNGKFQSKSQYHLQLQNIRGKKCHYAIFKGC